MAIGKFLRGGNAVQVWFAEDKGVLRLAQSCGVVVRGNRHDTHQAGEEDFTGLVVDTLDR